MAKQNFYDELDLRYPEIAICIDIIDRMNPGKRKFQIPILTPNLDNKSLKPKIDKVRQNSSNMMNDPSIAVSVSNIEVQNYIEISIPKEMCALPGGNYLISGTDLVISGSGNIQISGSTGSSGGLGSHSHEVRGGSYNMSGKENISGTVNLIPVDRYIQPGSKWIVVFVGGDITCPKIIGRYGDD